MQFRFSLEGSAVPPAATIFWKNLLRLFQIYLAVYHLPGSLESFNICSDVRQTPIIPFN